MRMRRLKAGTEMPAVYHCVTRTAGGAKLFEGAEMEMLRRHLWQVAAFSGVQVLTYCLLSNHFHVLVRVPARKLVSDAELVRRYRILYPEGTPTSRKQPKVLLENPAATVESTLAAGGEGARILRAALLRRMGDVSEFMKTLKQRFSIWYNQTHDRFGTLWAERFKSVLVENDSYALATVAAYIDLNPVRAGLVQDPKDYRFCGYGEAIGEGSRRIRDGLCGVLGCSNWKSVPREYRMILFGKGTTAKRDGSEAAQIPWEQAREVLNSGGKLPISTVLRCRVRYFSDGVALGSAGFVGEVLRTYQERTGRRSRSHRAGEPRPMDGTDWGGLTTLRGLRRAVFG